MALQQTWDWPEAREVVASARHMLLANDLMAAPLAPKVRNGQFRGFVRATQEVMPYQAMHWMNTKEIVHPGRFLFAQGKALAQPLYGSINVRFFTIQGTAGEGRMQNVERFALVRVQWVSHS